MHRGDNYFIQLNGKWVLVSGPWFDAMERMRYGNAFRVARPILHYVARMSDDFPVMEDTRYYTWMRMQWTNGLSKRFQHRLLYSPRRDDVYRARTHTGWIFEDGIVPPYMSGGGPEDV